MADLSGHLIFARAGSEYEDETIFVARLDGSDERQITEFGASCCPSAARDGSRIAFGGGAPDGRFTTVTADLDGSHRRAMPIPDDGNNYGGLLSSDGSLLLMEVFPDEGRSPGTFVAAPDGSGLRRLGPRPFIPGDFSPDNRQAVAFGGPEGQPPPAGSLWVMNVDGTGLQQLTPDEVLVQCCFNYRYSPDGDKVLFADADGVLWTIRPDGSDLEQLFEDSEGRFAITPTWSPDGSMVVFALDPTRDPFQHPPNAVFVIRADGSGLTELFGGNNFKREFVWVSG